jgi:hypothetical protein
MAGIDRRAAVITIEFQRTLSAKCRQLRGRLDRAWSGDIPTWIISGEAEFANSIAHQAELDRAFDLALDVLQNGGRWGRLGGPSSHLRAEIPKLAADQHRAVPPLSELYVGRSVPVSVLAQFQGAQPEAHGSRNSQTLC